MTSDKYVLMKLKTTSFAGSFVIGEFLGKDKTNFKIRNSAMVHYLVSQDKEGSIMVRPTFLVNTFESEGTWDVNEYEISSWRYVDTSEQTYQLYDQAISRFRVEKAGLRLPPAAQEPSSPLV